MVKRDRVTRSNPHKTGASRAAVAQIWCKFGPVEIAKSCDPCRARPGRCRIPGGAGCAGRSGAKGLGAAATARLRPGRPNARCSGSAGSIRQRGLQAGHHRAPLSHPTRERAGQRHELSAEKQPQLSRWSRCGHHRAPANRRCRNDIGTRRCRCRGLGGGRCRVRTCDPCRVKAVLYR